nr:tripartite tricarboxylate transporter substrate-binding protein [Xenophilus azovorans]
MRRPARRVAALAVTSPARSPLAPDVPTTAESGLKALEVEVLYVMMVPAATPEPIMAVLQRAVVDALAQPDVRASLSRLDMTVESLVGAQARERLDRQAARYGRVIKALDMKIE